MILLPQLSELLFRRAHEELPGRDGDHFTQSRIAHLSQGIACLDAGFEVRVCRLVRDRLDEPIRHVLPEFPVGVFLRAIDEAKCRERLVLQPKAGIVGSLVQDLTHQIRRPLFAAGAQMGRQEQDHLAPPGIGQVLSNPVERVASRGKLPGGQVLLEGGVREAVLAGHRFLEQPATFLDDPQPSLGFVLHVLDAGPMKSPGEQRCDFVEPQGERVASMEFESDRSDELPLPSAVAPAGLRQFPGRLALRVPDLVPVAQEELDAFVVNLDPPLRQFHVAVVDGAQHGQHQGVGSQRPDPRLLVNGLDQLGGSLLSLMQCFGRVPEFGNQDCLVPGVDEFPDVRIAQILDRAIGTSTSQLLGRRTRKAMGARA